MIDLTKASWLVPKLPYFKGCSFQILVYTLVRLNAQKRIVESKSMHLCACVMCMCVYVCVHVHVCVSACECVCMYICVCVYLCLYMCMYV